MNDTDHERPRAPSSRRAFIKGRLWRVPPRRRLSCCRAAGQCGLSGA